VGHKARLVCGVWAMMVIKNRWLDLVGGDIAFLVRKEAPFILGALYAQDFAAASSSSSFNTKTRHGIAQD
jgi:hypothetical protein